MFGNLKFGKFTQEKPLFVGSDMGRNYA